MNDSTRPASRPGNAGTHRRSGRRASQDGEPSLTELLHLREYWKTVRKRIWTLVNFFVLLVGSVVVLTLLQPRVYEAVASLQIDAVTPRYTQFQDPNALGTGQYLSDQEYYATQHARLRSRSMARAVLDRLDLWDDPEFAEAEDPVSKVLHMVTIEPQPKTRLVLIRCQHTDREFTESLCQAWAETFVERNLESMLAGITEGSHRLQEQVTKALKEAEDAEQKLLDFKRQHNTLALSSTEQENLLARRLDELTGAYARAQAERVKRQAEYQSLASLVRSQTDPLELSLLVQNDLLASLRTSLTEQRRLRAELAQRYLSGHPKMRDVETRISQIEAQIQAEVHNELARRESVYKLARDREDELESALSGSTTEVLDLGEAEVTYNELNRDAEAKSKLYEYLLQRLHETDVTADLQANNVQIVDQAEADPRPVKPNIPLNIGLAVLVGLAGGISLAVFFDYMDNTLKTREEVEALGIPFLGIIPSVPGLSGEGWERARHRYLYCMEHPKSAFAEFLRNIRTNIVFMARSEGPTGQRLLVTSAGPREGKTTTTVSVGITMAAGGKRVVVVDADLRRPSLHHAFDLPNDRGFSDLILGRASPDDCALPTGQDGLFVIPSGPRPGNPAELLGHDRVAEVFDRLDTLFDAVLIDSPPVVAVTDAVVLSQQVDGVILVVKSFKVGKDLVEQAKRQLLDVDANLVGVILNDFDIQRKSYGYYYYYNYYGSEPEQAGGTHRHSKAG